MNEEVMQCWKYGETSSPVRWGGTGVAGVFPDIMRDRVRYGRQSWFGQKNIKNLGFLLFVSYDLMSCEVFT